MMSNNNDPKKAFLPNEMKDYVRFYQVPTRRWWWGLIALGMGIVLFVLAFNVSALFQGLIPSEGDWAFPLAFLTNNIIVGTLVILAAVLVSWLFYRQGFGWLSSVEGQFRWKWFGLTVLVFTAGIALFEIMKHLFFPDAFIQFELAFRSYTLVMIAIILLATPLYAAMEEYFFRGLFARLIAAIVPYRRAGLILSAFISTGVFMLIHLDADPFRNIFYLSMGLMTWWLIYRTGGIEASVAYHAIANVAGQSILPFIDFNYLDGRGDDWSIIHLLPIVLHIVLVLIVDLIARRKGLMRMSSPPAPVSNVVKA